MKLITFYTQKYGAMADINCPRWISYCKKYKIDFECFQLPQIGNRNDFCWDKIELYKHVFNSVSDYLCWIDIDVFLIRDHFNIEYFTKCTDKPMIISSDSNGICTGFFILKKCEWSINYINSMLFLKNINSELEKNLNTIGAGDQSCSKYLLGFNNVLDNTLILDNDGLISNPSVGICDNTMAYHFWANGDDNNRFRIINEMEDLSKKYLI